MQIGSPELHTPHKLCTGANPRGSCQAMIDHKVCSTILGGGGFVD